MKFLIVFAFTFLSTICTAQQVTQGSSRLLANSLSSVEEVLNHAHLVAVGYISSTPTGDVLRPAMPAGVNELLPGEDGFISLEDFKELASVQIDVYRMFITKVLKGDPDMVYQSIELFQPARNTGNSSSSNDLPRFPEGQKSLVALRQYTNGDGKLTDRYGIVNVNQGYFEVDGDKVTKPTYLQSLTDLEGSNLLTLDDVNNYLNPQ